MDVGAIAMADNLAMVVGGKRHAMPEPASQPTQVDHSTCLRPQERPVIPASRFGIPDNMPSIGDGPRGAATTAESAEIQHSGFSGP